MPTIEESLLALKANPQDKEAAQNIRKLVDKDGNGIADSTEVDELALATKKVVAGMTAIEKQALREVSAPVLEMLSASKLPTFKDPVTGLVFAHEAGKKAIQAALDGADSPDVSQAPQSAPSTPIIVGDGTKTKFQNR